VDVLLEFDPKLIWVSGVGRVPGAAVFRLQPGCQDQVINFGAVNDSALTATISVFFRDSGGTVLATQDCVIQFQKSPGLPEPFDSILKTTDWIHRRLNLATYVILGLALLGGGLWLYLKIQRMEPDQREALAIRTHIAPGRYTGTWTEQFLIDPTKGFWLTRGDWTLPAQQWEVIHSPEAEANPAKGLARINSTAWGMPQPYLFNDQKLYDFTIEIRANLPAPSFTFSWVLRAQSGGNRGYIFTLRPFNKGIRVEGVVQWRFSKTPLIPVHGFDIPVDCCRKGDYLIFKMQASDYSFQITSFSLNNDDDYEGRDFIGRDILNPGKTDKPAAKVEAYRFQDGYGSYRYGSLAVFANDQAQPPEIEYVNVLGAK